MAVRLQEFTEAWQQPVRAFNSRLAQSQLQRNFQFPEDPPKPRAESNHFYEEYILATDNQNVRGAYILRHQMCSFFSDLQPIAHYRLPLSEGIVNRAYAAVGAQMVRDALRRQPFLFALGMGSKDKPLPSMLKILGWKLCSVPFLFRVNRTARFLRNIQAVRTNRFRELLLDLAAFSGAGAVAIPAIQRLRSVRCRDNNVGADVEPCFGSWADEVWQKARHSYPMVASRDSRFLDSWYSRDNPKFIRLRVSRSGETIGWALVLDSQMREDRYFGNMRLGTIADCFASPTDASAVVSAATRFLNSRNIDLIVANHSHPRWKEAFRRVGFLEGPSNFIFAASPKLATRIIAGNGSDEDIYINRGDGDGPIHL